MVSLPALVADKKKKTAAGKRKRTSLDSSYSQPDRLFDVQSGSKRITAAMSSSKFRRAGVPLSKAPNMGCAHSPKTSNVATISAASVGMLKRARGRSKEQRVLVMLR